MQMEGGRTVSPVVERPDPPYIQVVKQIRAQIESGDLQDGDTLPSARRIKEDWGISLATATKVLATLRAEGLARGVPGVGTLVTTATAGRGPQDRVVAMQRTGNIYPPNEHAKIASAELVEAPAHVADALGLDQSSPVIRRHRVTYRDDAPVSASVSWFDGALADRAPQLLEPVRIRQGTAGYIREMTGWAVGGPQMDQVSADAANEQDARDLGVKPGSPVLRGRNWMKDPDGGVIEYGEYVSVPGRWRTYEFEIAS